jgi:PRTRC genetic system ThiF family protein
MITLTAAPTLRLQLPAYTNVVMHLIGCGGTGSHIATGLGALAMKLREGGKTCQLVFHDGDRVEQRNVGRQLFTVADIGQAKSAVLAQRVSRAYGLVVSHSGHFMGGRAYALDSESLNVFVGAVDTPAARQSIHKRVLSARGQVWWLDCGNSNHSGQIALGNSASAKRLPAPSALGLIRDLPAPSLIYPELIRPVAKARRQNCAEALHTGEQGLMINRLMAAWALGLLHDFLFDTVRFHALDVDLHTGGTRPHRLDEYFATQAVQPKKTVAKGV